MVQPAWEFVMTAATLPRGCRQIVRRVLDHLAELAGVSSLPCSAGCRPFLYKLPWRMVERRLGVLVVAHPPRRARSKSCKVLERLAESHERLGPGSPEPALFTCNRPC